MVVGSVTRCLDDGSRTCHAAPVGFPWIAPTDFNVAASDSTELRGARTDGVHGDGAALTRGAEPVATSIHCAGAIRVTIS